MGTKTLLLSVFLGVLVTGIAQTQHERGAETGRGNEEAVIRRNIEDWSQAIREKDLDRVLSFYSPDIVSFDLDPPLRYVGAGNKRRAWEEFFAAHTGPVAYEVHELSVTTEGELAFVHGLNHVRGTLAGGRYSDLWVRWTACLQRINGVWLIVHDHVSVPADLKSGDAVLNLTP